MPCERPDSSHQGSRQQHVCRAAILFRNSRKSTVLIVRHQISSHPFGILPQSRVPKSSNCLHFAQPGIVSRGRFCRRTVAKLRFTVQNKHAVRAPVGTGSLRHQTATISRGCINEITSESSDAFRIREDSQIPRHFSFDRPVSGTFAARSLTCTTPDSESPLFDRSSNRFEFPGFRSPAVDCWQIGNPVQEDPT